MWSTIIPPIAGVLLIAWWLFLCVDARKAYAGRSRMLRLNKQVARTIERMRAMGFEVEVTTSKMRKVGETMSEHERGAAVDG